MLVSIAKQLRCAGKHLLCKAYILFGIRNALLNPRLSWISLHRLIPIKEREPTWVSIYWLMTLDHSVSAIVETLIQVVNMFFLVAEMKYCWTERVVFLSGRNQPSMRMEVYLLAGLSLIVYTWYRPAVTMIEMKLHFLCCLLGHIFYHHN